MTFYGRVTGGHQIETLEGKNRGAQMKPVGRITVEDEKGLCRGIILRYEPATPRDSGEFLRESVENTGSGSKEPPLNAESD